LFKDENLAGFLAASTIPEYNGENVRISNYDTFAFAYTSATTSSSDISNSLTLEFTLAGKPQIIWKYDAEKLKADLVNANKSALTTVLASYPAIEKANAVIRPFWKSKFPTKISEIEVIEVVETQE
jgi:hypothetical protein